MILVILSRLTANSFAPSVRISTTWIHFFQKISSNCFFSLNYAFFSKCRSRDRKSIIDRSDFHTCDPLRFLVTESFQSSISVVQETTDALNLLCDRRLSLSTNVSQYLEWYRTLLELIRTLQIAFVRRFFLKFSDDEMYQVSSDNSVFFKLLQVVSAYCSRIHYVCWDSDNSTRSWSQWHHSVSSFSFLTVKSPLSIITSFSSTLHDSIFSLTFFSRSYSFFVVTKHFNSQTHCVFSVSVFYLYVYIRSGLDLFFHDFLRFCVNSSSKFLRLSVSNLTILFHMW